MVGTPVQRDELAEDEVAGPSAFRRGLAVMAGWYVAPVLAAMVFLAVAPGDTSGPDRPCTAKTLECFQLPRADVWAVAGVLLLIVTVPVSLIALAVFTTKPIGPAIVTGTLGAAAGWLVGALIVWFLFYFRGF